MTMNKFRVGDRVNYYASNGEVIKAEVYVMGVGGTLILKTGIDSYTGAPPNQCKRLVKRVRGVSNGRKSK
jgi:hypothetical protein